MSATVRRSALLALLLAAIALAIALGCDRLKNREDRRAATRVGAPLEPGPTRGDPRAALDAACGPGGPTGRGAAAFARPPYVQDVRADRFTVAWTAPGGAPLQLRVARPDGDVVTEVDAALEPGTAGRPAPQRVATAAGLPAGATLCYTVLGADGPLTRPTGVRTAPAADDAGPVTFLAFGDSGNGSADQRAVARRMGDLAFDLALVTGDVAYEDGRLDELEHHFFAIYAPLLRSLPFYPVAGNHDLRTADGAPLREVFVLPDNGGPGGAERWFSFDRGPVHFVGLDTERLGPEQAAWLDADLAATDRPWRVVYGHVPAYSSGWHGDDAAMQSLIVPILERHGVQLYLAGHDHHYERLGPLRGVTYVITGGGGRGVRGVGRSAATAHVQSVLHVVVARVEGDWLALHAVDAEGRAFDGVRIPVRPAVAPAPAPAPAPP